MLSPEYLLRISEGGEELASSIRADILEKIIERISIRLSRGEEYILTATDKWNIQTLQEAGLLLEDIQKLLAQRSGLMEEEIAEAFEDAGVKTIGYDNSIYEAAGLSPSPLDKSPALVRILQRTFEATLGEWKNFTRSYANAAQVTFLEACDKAYSQVVSGAMSYSQAYLEAIESVILDGPKVKWTRTDPVTGDEKVYHTDTLETATLRCIRTGVSQASGQITDARMEEMDWDIILVSSHLGARVTDSEDFTNHYWWQGQFYSRTGRDKRFKPYSVCGQGHVQGIHGANCRHSHGPGDGEHNPFAHYDSEENKKEYELQQKQREMERRIRETKSHLMGYKKALENSPTEETRKVTEEKYQKKAALLKKQNEAYTAFCKENDLKPLNERLSVAKWDRKQAAQAREAAKNWENRVTVHDARASDTFHVIPPEKGDSIKAQSLFKELQKSEVGKAAYKYIIDNDVYVSVKYDGPKNLRGRCFGKFITVYANETKSIKKTTQTIIHEATHLQLNRKKYTQWEEAYCYAQELKHEKTQLTWSDLRDIIKWAKKNYPEYPWR